MTKEPNPTSDEILRKTLLALFAANDRTASVKLHVGVSNGFVHLAGVVSSIELRVVAAEIASEVAGVRGVVNRIERLVRQAPPEQSISILIKTKRNLKYDKIFQQMAS